LRCFIDAGADLDAVDANGRTPLHRVIDYQCAALLVAAGSNLNARDLHGRSAIQCTDISVVPAFLAAGADPSELPELVIPPATVETARRDIASTRLDFVRYRALQVCIGLQSLSLDALQMCEILQHACGPVAHVIAFHQWWKIATTVKHFHLPLTNVASTF
jgi:hypothetical protein